MGISRKVIVGAVVGALVLGWAVSSAVAEQSSGARSPEGAEPAGGRPGGPAMRSEAVFPARDGHPVTTVRRDFGVLTSVSGAALTIKEDDGTVVEIPVDEGTRIGRDGKKAVLADLKAGDHIAAVRVKEGDGEFVTKGVRAISPERYRQMEARRKACQARPRQCRTARGPGRGAGGAAPAAGPEDSTAA